MNLPKAYQWLLSIAVLPRVISVALQLFGTAEVVGRGSNRTIIGWRDALNQAGHKITGYSDDDIPWCGLFVAYVVHMAGKVPVHNPLWARNWAQYGEGIAERVGQNLVVRMGFAPSLGDVLVFVRDGGGHVGFYIGEDATHFHVLGGNQGNRVSIVRIAKDRCIAVRRHVYKAAPDSVKPYRLAATGIASKNEA